MALSNMYTLTAHHTFRALPTLNTATAGAGLVLCGGSITRNTFILRGRKRDNTGMVDKLPKSINSFRLLARKNAGAGTFNNTNEYVEEELDKLLDEYGEIVFTNPNQRSPSAELNDDAESLSFVVALAKAADDIKAVDIQVLCVKRLVYWTSFFIIATAFSNPQIDAIGKKMRDIAEQQFKKFPTGDVKPNSWTLLDFGEVVVHIFLPQQREFYNLEEFYGNATPIELPFKTEVSRQNDY
ncbi:protein Iojap, chloroplastic isoform X2 [Cryptomeria japonica]|uniref:protein Iojap, chloroplastic isoform X2 n=1 Tax=Cryptomeria japonica TaxID=3369 RepID=UPI0025AC6145|nr:protein Iojap, chloroplastic isoform X2 [Cryptomeria japonica]